MPILKKISTNEAKLQNRIKTRMYFLLGILFLKITKLFFEFGIWSISFTMGYKTFYNYFENNRNKAILNE